MFSSLSNILDTDTEMLKQQCKEMWQWHKKQQFQAYQKEVTEVCCVEQIAQKVKKAVKARIKEKSI